MLITEFRRRSEFEEDEPEYVRYRAELRGLTAGAPKMLMQDLIYELAAGDPLKVNGLKQMKVSDAMIWMLVKEKKAYTEWLVQRNFKNLQ